ncbi:DUF6045 family protein [Ruminococcaceae bacterium OttesenSCG-928-D13]|nr:DUF6045 family protein [Ruminococcaceae bacterium OttesenSCG-928-D13]
MFIWDFVFGSVMDEIIAWCYGQVVGFFGNFFSSMGSMGSDLFAIDAIQGIVLFFQYLGWALYGVGLIVACFEVGIEHQSGRGNFRDAGLNAVKGFMAVSLFTIAPVELYKLAVNLQSSLTVGLTNFGNWDALAQNVMDAIGTFEITFNHYNPVTMLFVVILMAYAVIKVFFGNLKRGGILLIQIAVGSLYMFSVPRGYIDGFLQWMKQVIGLCLTTFLQATFLTIGLLIVPQHPILGLGLMLSAGEVPRIAGAFGLETSTKANIMSAVYTAQAAVNTTKMIATAVTK